MEFLGHTVGEDGVSVVSDKVGAVRDWPVPQSVQDVQAFLGLCNYYQHFIAWFARVARPLTDLTHKSSTFEWSEGCSEAFEQLKLLLTMAPILQVIDPKCKHEVHVDASDFACGATLLQEQIGRWLPVEYYSHRFSVAESKYSAMECEFVAVIQGLRRWRHYLLGRRFVVRTDHASLKCLQTQPQLSRRQVRWLDFLGEFEFEVQHIAGRANVVPDALSQCPDLIQGQLGAQVALHELESDLVAQLCDAQRAAAGQQSWDDLVVAATASQCGYELHDGLVCKSRSTGGAASVVVPDGATELKQELLRMHHDPPLSGHLGLYRMVQAVSQRYYWHGLYADIKRYCKECVTCQAAKVNTRAPQGQLQPLSAPRYRFKQVTVDLITHLPTTLAGHNSICTFVDRLSKWVYFVPCSETITADGLAQLFLSVVVAKHGMPQKLISDRDPPFMSKFWQALVRVLGCEHAVNTAYHLQTDGQMKRFHRSVKQVLRCYVSSQQTNWDIILPACEFALNSTHSVSTGYSPAFVLYGREPVLLLEQAVRDVVDTPVQSVVDLVGAMQHTVEVVHQSLSRAVTYMAEYANRR